MNKKLVFQISIFIVALLLFIIIYYFYSAKQKKLILSNTSDETNGDIVIPNENIIKDMEYFSENESGDSFKITSDYGKINFENPDLTLMVNVTAVINLKKSEIIQITSNFANFNNKSYETKFFEKVLILRDDEKITSEKLEFSLAKNLITISEDVILNKPGFNTRADKVTIDLTTKNFMITMKNEKQIVIVSEIK
tara:strand:+ start:1125 stop:1709 length:585 start_codon:yes stop_codon:yes gene_type:complete